MRWLLLVVLFACCSSGEPAWVTKERARLEEERAVLERDRAQLAKERAQLEADRGDQRSGLKVNLPSGTATDIDVTRASVVVVMTTDSIVVNGQPIKEADLDRLFRAAYARDKDVQVVIKADRGTAHARVVEVMEQAKMVGITRLAIGTSGSP